MSEPKKDIGEYVSERVFDGVRHITRGNQNAVAGAMSGQHKTQIWLRPDQIDLLRTLLEADLILLEERSLANRLEWHLLRFCRRRIDELLALLPSRVQLAPKIAEGPTP